MSLRGALGVALVALAAIPWPAAALAAEPVRLTAAFDRGARLGSSTALRIELRIDPRRAPSPVVEARLLYPESLGIVSSGLGLASCRLPTSDFQQVLIGRGPRSVGCSPNAVIGRGTAVADVRLGDGQVIPEFAVLSLLTGPIEHGTLGLVVDVDGQRPFGAKLVYAGAVRAASPPFGGALAFSLPSIPALEGFATVALVHLRLAIGSHAITYYAHRGTRTIAYHPDGIALPDHCPKRGFRFRAVVAFEDGGRAAAETVVPCPRRALRR